jgi:hypothetical protein
MRTEVQGGRVAGDKLNHSARKCPLTQRMDDANCGASHEIPDVNRH